MSYRTNGILNTILFIIPFISAVFLFIDSRWLLVVYGLALIIGTIFFLIISYPLEKLFATKLKNNLRTLRFLMHGYYFILVIGSVTLSWLLINSPSPGNIWLFLFAFSCCYIPYTYMLQGEQAKTNNTCVLTNTVNNFSIFGYLLFGVLMNFTAIGIFWSYMLLILVGIFFLIGLPRKSNKAENVLK